MDYNRKEFITSFGLLSAGVCLIPGTLMSRSFRKDGDLFFDLSLAEWSYHQPLFDGKITHMQFPSIAKEKHNIRAVEYVNQFFKDKAQDKTYLNELNKRCDDLGVDQLLIMIDGEGDLAVNDEAARNEAVENHYKWIEAANHLGCHSIRVNLFGDGTKAEMKIASVDSLGQLAEYASDYNVNVIVENHGGWSSDADWLTDVMQQVDRENCGVLPDFGNFCIKRKDGARWEAPCVKEYNRYEGVRKMMPYAKGVSAKSYAFNEQGEETTINYKKMLQIVKNAGFTGHIGIEYEGQELSPEEGVRATKKLLTKLGQELA